MTFRFDLKWVLVVLLGVSIFFNVLQGADRSDVGGKLADANARAALYESRYDVVTGAYRALAQQVTSDGQLIHELRGRNEELATEIEEAEGTILSLQSVVASFEQQLAEGTTEEVQVTPGVGEEAGPTYSFDLFSREEWGEGSFLEVDGPVRVGPRQADWELAVRGAFQLTTVVDRRNETDLAVSVFFDNDNFRATSVEVVNNVFDPLLVPNRSFFGKAWQAVKAELFDLTAWRHRAEGAALLWGVQQLTGGGND